MWLEVLNDRNRKLDDLTYLWDLQPYYKNEITHLLPIDTQYQQDIPVQLMVGLVNSHVLHSLKLTTRP